MSKTSRIIQIVLLVAIMAAGINLFLYLRQRRAGLAEPKKQEVALDPDYYVTPKKLHPQDLKDAKELTRQPVWIREGYRFAYYPYAGHTDFQHPAGTLDPIEKLDIKDVDVDHAPQSGIEKQVMAVFEKGGQRFAFPIGLVTNGDYKIYSDDILFIQDPHELYKHWPADVWKLIDAHQMQPGMNELQASFAIGMGAPEGSGMSNPRIVDYPNHGHPLRVTYTNGKATLVQPGS
jgi:hypothetical protein